MIRLKRTMSWVMADENVTVLEWIVTLTDAGAVTPKMFVAAEIRFGVVLMMARFSVKDQSDLL